MEPGGVPQGWVRNGGRGCGGGSPGEPRDWACRGGAGGDVRSGFHRWFCFLFYWYACYDEKSTTTFHCCAVCFKESDDFTFHFFRKLQFVCVFCCANIYNDVISVRIPLVFFFVLFFTLFVFFYILDYCRLVLSVALVGFVVALVVVVSGGGLCVWYM